MEQNKIDLFIMTNKKYLPQETILYLKDRLLDLDESKFALLSTVEMKDPTTLLLMSIFLGSFGVDRFMLGETGMGVLKLLTGGLCGILSIIDWFTIQKKTKELNYKNLISCIEF